MANTTIKITQLPNIGTNLQPNTVLPVVDTSGVAVTDKVSVGNLANYILTEAGNTLQEAFVSTLAYSVTNSAQPNITSVGTLDIGRLHISGGTNGYVLQTDGTGNLTWTAQTGGNGGNGVPGGANTQVQFNNAGQFGGDPEFTYDQPNNRLSVNQFSANYIQTNVINADALYGEGGNITNVSANTANVAYSVDVSNVSGLGNIATLNLDGNSSNVLFGNGMFASSPAGYSNTDLVNYIETNGLFVGGNINPTEDGAYFLGNSDYRWDSLSLSGTLAVDNSIYFSGDGSVQAVNNLQLQSSQGSNNTTWTFGVDGRTTFPSGMYLDPNNFFTSSGSLGLVSNDYVLILDETGNLTVPRNINAYQGDDLRIRVSSGSLGLVSNDYVLLLDDAGNLTVPRNINAYEGNDLRIRVNNPNSNGGVTYRVENYQVDISNRTTVFDVLPNSVVITTDYSANAYQWIFDNTGNLTVQGNIITGNGEGGDISGVNVLFANYLYGDGSNISNLTISGGSNPINTTGNITGGNIISTGTVNASVLIGDGGNISNIQVANVTGLGNVATLNLDGSNSNVLYGNGEFAPSYILSNSGMTVILDDQGALDLTVNGVIRNDGPVNMVSNNYVQMQYINGPVLGVDPNATTDITHWIYVNGEGAVIETNRNDPNGYYNWSFDPQGNFNVANNIVLGANTENASISGANAVFANYFIGDGGLLSNIAVSGNTTISTSGNVTAGNISGTTLKGDGGNISNIQGANVSGQVAFANVANRVAGANVNGLVANANFAAYSGVASSANSVAGANVTGQVSYAATANSVAGGNVTGQVSYAAVANSVARANVVGLGNIAAINLNGSNSQILYGNGGWATAPATYGDSNVVSLLASFGSNTLVTTGNANIGNLNVVANGDITLSGASSNIQGANIVTANYFSGSGNLLSNIQLANVSGAGNIASINLNGSNSQVLYGNGVFAAVSGGNVTGAKITVSDNAPNTANIGDLWYESDVGELNIYYSNTWVQANPASSSILPSSISGPTILSAITTAPTKATTTITDYINLVDDGTGWCTVNFSYSHAVATGSANGSGSYLWGLPGGYQFSSTYHPYNTDASINVNGYASRTILPGSSGFVSSAGFQGTTVMVPYNATQFRIVNYPIQWNQNTVNVSATTNFTFIDQGDWAINGANVCYSGQFRFKKV